MNTDTLRKSAPLIAAVAVPVAGYLIYRNLTPKQKRKFKKAFTEGTLGFASAIISKIIDQYRKENTVDTRAVDAEIKFNRIATIPNKDESETTIGDERW